jgi:5-methylcytosine-specific restriction endonuclease McrA
VARRADTPCSLCGRLMFRGSSSLPPERMTCQPCRSTGIRRQSAKPKRRGNRPIHQVACPCGAVVMREACYGHCSRSCAKRFKPSRLTRDEQDRKAQRRARERAAPGLTQRQRGELLGRWRIQGRVCWACRTMPATTVDHLVPLHRGGTNYEGNLAPACRPCNGRRRHLLVVEWLHRVRVGQVQGMATTQVA